MSWGAVWVGLNRTSVGLKFDEVHKRLRKLIVASIEPAWD